MEIGGEPSSPDNASLLAKPSGPSTGAPFLSGHEERDLSLTACLVDIDSDLTE